MKIKHALDWQKVSIDLLRELKSVGYNPDLNKMYKNIDNMVQELSKLEVTFRRVHKTEMLNDKVTQINNAIDHLSKLILMAKLMR